MKRAMYIIFNILLGLGVVTTAMGTLYYVEPSIFEWFFDWLDLSEGMRSVFTMTIGGTTIAGIGTKVLRTVVNTDNLKRDALHELEVRKIEEKYSTEINSLKSDFEELIKVVTETSNENVLTTNKIVEQNNLLLEERKINAERMLATSSTLVPTEIKNKYKKFHKELENQPAVENVENFYVENTTIIKEKVVENLENKKLTLTEQLKKDKEV